MRTYRLGLAVLVAALGLTVASATAATSNENAAQQIANNLKQSGKLKGYRVGVKYEDGVAWLSGTVTSENQKRIAEQIARESAGVDHVICKLDVELQSPKQNDVPVSYEQPQEINPASMRVASTAPMQQAPRSNMPRPYAYTTPGGNVQAGYQQAAAYCPAEGCPSGEGYAPGGMGQSPSYDNPQMPGYAWPSYAASPNYAALTYPKQYSASAWPYIGPFYPYPQVPLGWRKVTLEWDDGWWFLDFKDSKHSH